MIYRGRFQMDNDGGTEENILKDFRISNVPLDSAGAVVSFMAVSIPTARNNSNTSFSLNPRITGMFIGGRQVIEYADLAYPRTASGNFNQLSFQGGPISPEDVLIDGEPAQPGELVQVSVQWSSGQTDEVASIMWQLTVEEV